MITKKMTTFCSDTPLIWFKEEELQDTRGRGVGTSPLFSHHAWDDLIMKKLWDLALLGTCYVIQLPLSCFGCRFAASRNSCFEITSVVSQFSLPTPPLPSPPLSVHVPVKQTPDIVKVCPRNKIRKHSSCWTWFKWERWCNKIPFYPLHFLKPLEKAAIASLQSHKESIDIGAHFSSVISFA